MTYEDVVPNLGLAIIRFLTVLLWDWFVFIYGVPMPPVELVEL